MLRIALVADDLTQQALSAEYAVQPVRLWFKRWAKLPGNASFLLVESAWNGFRGSWKYQIASYPDHPERNNHALAELVARAKDRGLPTVFWNKEDCTHFDRFIASARLFDHVFTVDANCVPRYRAVMGSKASVHVLPFAVQPKLHFFKGFNFKYKRALFVGSYSQHIHPERRAFQDKIFAAAAQSPLGLTVVDRNSGRNNSRYRYPNLERLETLPRVSYPQTAQFYRDYLVSLNVNTVTDSASMFSRRLIEILACGGIAVTNPSLAVERWFDDYCWQVREEEEMSELFARLAKGPSELDLERSRAGAEYVLKEHTWKNRMVQVWQAICHKTISPVHQEIWSEAICISGKDLKNIAMPYNPGYNSKQSSISHDAIVFSNTWNKAFLQSQGRRIAFKMAYNDKPDVRVILIELDNDKHIICENKYRTDKFCEIKLLPKTRHIQFAITHADINKLLYLSLFIDDKKSNFIVKKEDVIYRFLIYNLNLKKNGVILFFPSTNNKYYPYYPRLTWAKNLNKYCTIYIADPLFLHPKYYESHGSWFISRDNNLLFDVITNIINNLLQNDYQFLLTYGSSMGGYASLASINFLKQDISIAECPQITLSNYRGIHFSISKEAIFDNAFKMLQRDIKTKIFLRYNYGDDTHIKQLNNEIYAKNNKDLLCKNILEIVFDGYSKWGHSARPLEYAIPFIYECIDKWRKQVTQPHKTSQLQLEKQEIIPKLL